MKTILRSLLYVLLAITLHKAAFAQCAVSDVIIQNIVRSASQVPGTCSITFDASFTIENNNGNKYIFIHVWLQEDYPNYFRCLNGRSTLNGAIRSPRAVDLNEAFFNLGINNNLPTPSIITDYPPDGNVPMASVATIEREVLPDGSAVFTLTGIAATIPVDCGTPAVLSADLWSTQSAQAQVAHCVNCGLRYSAGYLIVSGLANCASLTYNATITNRTNVAISGNYRVYADANGDGQFSPALDPLIQDTTNFSVGSGVGTTISITGSIPLEHRNRDIFIVITQTSGAAAGASRVNLINSTLCSPLPVTFTTFRASRATRATVTLSWETATENNNSGFAIQRNIGKNVWEQVTFIPSLAQGGNSSSTLRYSFTDMNTNKGISQYRLRQVDLDGRARFSEVRSVRGDGQNATTMVFPIPSTDGRVNVVFDDKNTTRDLTLIDMNGRVVRQWSTVRDNSIQIENLRTGIYSLRIHDTDAGIITVEKIIVSSN